MSSKAPMCSLPQAGVYAGNITPQEAWARLRAEPNALLVDVRTPEEWKQGVPDAQPLAMVSWKTNPGYALNPQFAAQLKAAGAKADMPLFFMCRSGGRSTDAAIAMTAEGYTQCYNVSGGFEAEGGWKASNLSWRLA